MTAPAHAPTKVVGRRTAAWVIDLVPSLLLFVVGVRAFGEAQPVSSSLFDDDDLGSGVTTDASINASLSFGDTEYVAEGGRALAVYALVLAWGLLNSVLLQGTTGASVGKQLLGLRVVREDGQVCGIGKALVRWVLLVVDAFPFFIPLVGFVMVLSTRGNRRLGDLAAGTYVVRRADAGRPVVLPGPVPYGQPAQGPAAYGQPQGQVPYGQPQQAPPGEPQWDAARGTWIRWDGSQWLQHDQASDQWRPL